MINLRKMRLNQNLSQKELSKKAEIKQNTISQIELGVRNPSIATAQKIAAALHCTVDELLKEEKGG